MVKPECIIATNTSSIPITLLATSVEKQRRPRFIGAHFFAPAFIMTLEDIDTACQLGLGHPIGPFALMDMADLSMALDVGNLLLENYGERFRFGTALRQRIAAGHLGRKTEQGWHTYDK